jgi:orotate phosphoribosyltransferase-like protein
MHKLETYLEAKKLYSNGYNKVQISKKLNIPRGTINDWLLGRINLKNNKRQKSNNFNPKIFLNDYPHIGT